jgi:hypothetical protein
MHDVRDFLGHANIPATSRYLRSAPTRLADALTRLEAHQRQWFLGKVAQTSHKTSNLTPAGAASNPKQTVLLGKSGEPPGTRTPNPQIKSLLLCQLS